MYLELFFSYHKNLCTAEVQLTDINIDRLVIWYIGNEM